jgi:hypothetical protein
VRLLRLRRRRGRRRRRSRPGDGWHNFSFEGTTPLGDAQPFTFTNTRAATLDVTDVLCPGDIYLVYDNRVLIGPTSAPDPTVDCSYDASTGDPSVAMYDPVYSSGWITLAPGTHSITIAVASSPYPFSGGLCGSTTAAST